MNLFFDAIAWIATNWADVQLRLLEHFGFTMLALLIATAIAMPLGYAIGHTGKGREVAVALSGAARALPSLGLLTILALALSTTRSLLATIIVLLVLGVPSILAGAYAGIQAIDRQTIDAAKAMGMTGWQVLWRVEMPLGLPLLLGGLRNATLQIVATATLAAYIGLGGLGEYIFHGLGVRDFTEMLAGAILVALLALALDGIFAILQRVAVPRGVAALNNNRDVRSRPTRSRAVTEPSVESGRG